MTQHVHHLLFVCLLALLAGLAVAEGQIDISPVAGFNLKIIDRPTAQCLVVQPDPRQHNWFAGKFINLPVDQPVEIRVNMTNCDTPGNLADTGKWAGLRPVYSYADPEKYEGYEWFRRDPQGRWISGDLFKRGEARVAGVGETPEQSVVPAPLAVRLLSEDGQYWSPWGEIEGGTNNTTTRTFTFTIHPAAPVMTIAMHVPYLVAYDQELLRRVKAAAFPGVSVDEIMPSAGGRMLSILRVDDPAAPVPLQVTPSAVAPQWYARQRGGNGGTVQMTDARPTIAAAPPTGDRRVLLLEAREHPGEHTGSWAVYGALRALLADTPEARRLRAKTTWLLLPIFDPDGAAAAEYDTRTDFCRIDQSATPEAGIPEAIAYLSYLRAFANAGYFFTAAATFYSLECSEGKPVCCPFAQLADKDRVTAFNRYWFQRLQLAGVPAGPAEPWNTGSLPFRLATGCGMRYQTLALTFEINDRYPEYRLALDKIQQLGGDFPAAFTEWTALPAGAVVMTKQRAAQRARLDKLERNQLSDRGMYSNRALYQLLNDF